MSARGGFDIWRCCNRQRRRTGACPFVPLLLFKSHPAIPVTHRRQPVFFFFFWLGRSGPSVVGMHLNLSKKKKISKLIGISVSARRCLTIQKRISSFSSVKSAFIYAESRSPKVAGALKCFSVLSDGSIVKSSEMSSLICAHFTVPDILWHHKRRWYLCQVVLFSFSISKHVEGSTKIQFYFEIPVSEKDLALLPV